MKLRILLVVARLTTRGSACSSAVNSEYLKQAQADALSRVAVKYAQVGQTVKSLISGSPTYKTADLTVGKSAYQLINHLQQARGHSQ
jgi:hypothetical protein